MKGMLVNIDELIRTTLVQTNGTVSWQTIATMIAGGVNRVQPVSANSIAKYVMSNCSTAMNQQSTRSFDGKW
jgi:hypothetical protein